MRNSGGVLACDNQPRHLLLSVVVPSSSEPWNGASLYSDQALTGRAVAAATEKKSRRVLAYGGDSGALRHRAGARRHAA